jgi:hypothetical protein
MAVLLVVISGVIGVLGLILGRRLESRQWLRAERMRVYVLHLDLSQRVWLVASMTHKALHQQLVAGEFQKGQAPHADLLYEPLFAMGGSEALIEMLGPEEVATEASALSAACSVAAREFFTPDVFDLLVEHGDDLRKTEFYSAVVAAENTFIREARKVITRKSWWRLP